MAKCYVLTVENYDHGLDAIRVFKNFDDAADTARAWLRKQDICKELDDSIEIELNDGRIWYEYEGGSWARKIMIREVPFTE